MAKAKETTKDSLMNRFHDLEIDLLHIPVIGRLLTWRGLQPALHLVALAVFSLIILTGILGTPVGSANLSIIFVWIFWFVLLIWLLIPLFGRLWCLICPLPAPAEWLSRLGVYQKFHERFSLGIKWPAKLDNIWLQNFFFVGIALTSPIVLTRASVTGVLLGGFMVAALALDLVFTSRDKYTGRERPGRIFCRYVCPISGLIGLYSLVAPFGMRVRDFAACERHKRKNPHLKECIAGCGPGTDNPSHAAKNEGYGCPWFVYPGELKRNAYCGLCTECIKTCPLDNATFRFKPFGFLQDLFKAEKRHLDEAFKAFIMLGAAGLFTSVMLGWWPELKDIGNYMTELRVFNPAQFGLYAPLVLAVTLVAVPGLHLLFTAASKMAAGAETDRSIKDLFVHHAYALIPHGLIIWIAFCFSFAFISGSYILNVINDPFGWGWNLFGLKNLAWTPVLSGWIPIFQAIVLTGGLVVSIYVTYRISVQVYRTSKAALRATGVYTIFLLGITWSFLYLYVG